MRTKAVLVGISLFSVTACAGASVRGPLVPEATAEERTVIGLVPARGQLAVLQNGEARVVEGLVAGARLAIDDDGSVAAANDVMASGVVAIAHVGDAFLFLDRAGDVYYAASFLGPLEHRGHVGLYEFEALPDSPGRLAVLSGMDLYTSTGALPLVRAGLPPGTVVDGAFRDEQHGLAKLDGGVVMSTVDGGATWRPLHLDAPAVYIGATRERIGVLVAGPPPNVFVVNAAGDGGSFEEWPDSGSPLPEEAIEVAIAGAFPGFGVDQGEESPGVTHTRLASDALLVRTEQAHFFRVDPGTRTIAPTFGDMSSGCYFQRWGEAAAILCVGTPDGTTVDRSRDGSSLERVFAMPPMEWQHFSADGRSAAWRGGCPGGPPDELCVVREATGFRHEAHPIAADRLSVPAGDWLLVSTGEGTDEGSRMHLLRLSDGVEVPIEIPAGRTARVATLAADGSLLSIVATRVANEASGYDANDDADDANGDEERVLLLGPPGGPLTERALPAGIWGVAFLDARRALAAGADASVLARTLDGGATWESLPSPVRGDPSGLNVVEDRLVGAPIGCDVVGCWAGVRMLVTMRGWGGALDVRSAYLASVPRTAFPEPAALARVSLTCEASSARAPTPAPWTGRAPRGATIVTRVLGPSASARISIGDGGVRVEWRGRDERGAYAAATRETPLSEVSDIDPRLVSVHAASRDWIDVAICPGGVCRALHGRPDATLVEVPNDGSSTTQTIVLSSRLGADRDAVLVAEPYGAEVAIVHAVGADGSLSRLATASLPGYRRHVGLAVRGPAELAVVAERQSAPGFVLVPVGGDVPSQVLGGRERLAVCAAGPTPAEAWTATLIGGLAADGEAGALDVVLTTDVELTAHSACVRRVRLGAASDADAVPAVLAAEGGTLVGVGGRLDGWNEVRCTLREAE